VAKIHVLECRAFYVFIKINKKAPILGASCEVLLHPKIKLPSDSMSTVSSAVTVKKGSSLNVEVLLNPEAK
jgi:hypothetical protein